LFFKNSKVKRNIQFHFHIYTTYFCFANFQNTLEQNHPLLNRIKKNLKQLKPYLTKNKITCFRAFDWDMPEFPLCIDCYETQIHVAEYKTKNPLTDIEYAQWMNECLGVIQLIFQVDENNIFIKKRERMKGSNQYEKVNEAKTFTMVQEQGVNFLVNLHDYLDTGLFLDHRPTRKLVMEEAEGKHVLNLFAYTGSFSVYAAVGKAFTTTTVDLSSTYLNWAKENFKVNNLPLAKHNFIKADAKEWIKQTPTKLYDIVILDPPTISRSKLMKSKFDIQPDHVELINHVMKHIKPDGVLYFSNNFRDFKLDANAIVAQSIKDITLQSIPDDFRNKKIHYCWKIIK
jgi:23S rRNA (cytosine1962-C5)-methyltransferase